MKIKLAESIAEKSELDQLLWNVLWMPLNLPRDVRSSFRLGKPEVEIVAVDRSKVVGGLVANRVSESEFEIRHIAVCASYQGHSVGRLLVQELISRTGKGSVTWIRTYARNTSVGFFSRLGFVPEGDFDHQHRAPQPRILEGRLAFIGEVDPKSFRSSREAVGKHPSVPTPSGLPSFLRISEALHMNIFHQPLRNRFFDSLV